MTRTPSIRKTPHSRERARRAQVREASLAVARYRSDRGRLYKGTREIHHALEGDGLHGEEPANARLSFPGVVTQIMPLDVVFSLDSVITAVGMANTLWVMASAIIIAVVIMLVASAPLADFVQR